MKLGDEVKVTFLDHCQGSEDLIECEVFGKIIGQDKKKLTVCSWDIIGQDKATTKENRLIFTLIKSAIIKIEEI